MTLDDESLEILRAVEGGQQVFSPSAEADDARLAFDRMVDRILGMADTGLVEGSYNMTQPNYMGGIGKYALVQVIGITEAGRRALARHEPPAQAVAVVVRKKVKQEYSGRGQEFGRKGTRLYLPPRSEARSRPVECSC